ncbi:proline dehydrogenase family protein [Leucobacter allii]|uniref:proline dehydrogenase family protein n=1 Tax=Leucobacter allii TaxID=2932247 RepID=UPI001FD0395A|nr:proline dehydrogenase family protein [Leucobacter allii]UOR01702.1 proline dehydrogenase family protein [Leucobacter allii]
MADEGAAAASRTAVPGFDAVAEQTAAWSALAGAAGDRAEAWIARARDAADAAPPAEVLAGLTGDPESFAFTRRLLELVAGTDDAFASAAGLREVAQEVPRSMPVRDRLAVRAGGATSLGLPWAVMPVARRWLRERVAGLVLAARLPEGGDPGRLSGLAEAIRRHAEAGLTTVVAPLGEPVHGPAGAEAEAARLTSLAAHAAVRHLQVDPARLAPGGSDWSAESDTARAARALRPILEAAAQHGTTIHIAPSSVRWARLVPDLLGRALADPELDRARVGVRLFAELPESREHYDRISRWAQRRVADGGAAAEVVIGVAGVAGAERIASILSGLPVPVIEDRAELRAQFLRLAELALHPGRAAVLRPVLATEDPVLLAAARELAERSRSAELASLQLRSGVATGLAGIVADSGIDVRIALPVVAPKRFGSAVDLLVGFAAEAADPASDVSRLAALLAEDEAAPAAALAAARGELAAAARLAVDPAPASHRTQLRAREWDPSERDSALFYRAPEEPVRFDTGGLTAAVLGLSRGADGEMTLADLVPPLAIPVVSASGFAGEPGTDASVPANREWVRELLDRAADAAQDRDPVNDTVALSAADLDPERAAQDAREDGERWTRLSHGGRASRLRRAALAVVAARDRLLQALAADTGAPVAELDAEVDDLVDAARYTGQLAEGLAAVRGASFAPERLVLVAADAATPLAAQAEAVLAALGAGAGVLWAVPQRVADSARILLEEWEAGGIVSGAVRLEAVAETRTLTELVAHREVDRAVILGDRAAATALARARPDLRVEGRFRARGSVIVTPSADLDAAIADLVASAFRGAGTDLRAAHAAILVGSVARSRRFREGLADAVRALRPGDTARPGDEDPLAFDLGPLPAPPDAAGLAALTELGRGERWLVEPQRLDAEGRLWSPGVRLGVAPESSFWDDARGVPVLGIAHARSLGEAVELQNAAGSGAVAGLQSADAHEVEQWIAGAEAAGLALNRPTTGARVERHPSGGWNDAVMGLPALSGGPNRLLPFGSWQPRAGTRSETLHLRGLEPEVQLLIEAAQPVLDYADFDGVRRAALADALVWRTGFGAEHDAIGLGIERNLVRYHPVQTQVRLAEHGPLAALVRVLAAALLVRAPITVSTGVLLPPGLGGLLDRLGIEVSLERDDAWVERLAVAGPVGSDGVRADRVRLIGGDPVRAAEWLGGLDRTALWAEPVTMAGPVELLTLLREQSVSARAHRHGLAIPVPGLEE